MSTNTHLKVFIRFQIMNRCTSKCHVPEKYKKERGVFVTTKLMHNLTKCVTSKRSFHTNFVFPAGNLSFLIRYTKKTLA